MADRHLHTPLVPEHSNVQTWNHSQPNPTADSGTITIAVAQANSAAAHHSFRSWPADPDRSSSLSLPLEVPHHGQVPGLSHLPFMPSYAGNPSSFTQYSQSFIQQHQPSYYNAPLMTGDMGYLLNTTMDGRGTGFKRRLLPPLPIGSHKVYANGYDSNGASSSNSSLPPAMENGFPRNVRSRHSQNSRFEAAPSGAYPSNIPSHGIYLGSAMVEQWNHPPMVPSGTYMGVSSVANGTMEAVGWHHYNLLHGQNSGPGFGPVLHGSSSRDTRMNHGNHVNNAPSYAMSNLSQQASGFAVPLPYGWNQPGLEAASTSWNSRPLSLGRSGGGRSSRGRNIYERPWPIWSNAGTSSGGLFSEGSWNSFDQHRDMRLDIDNLSYEELLALGETIGNVSTGLSCSAISKCVASSTCDSQAQDAATTTREDSCAICLEDYLAVENQGRLSCEHGFHFRCIEKWLLMKNVCPVCRTPAKPAKAAPREEEC